MKTKTIILAIFLFLVGCAPGNISAVINPKPSSSKVAVQPRQVTVSQSPAATGTPEMLPSVTLEPKPSPSMTPPVAGSIPNFSHIIIIVLENKDYGEVIGSSKMPYLNELAQKNVLLSNFYAVTHPSLPNYIALFSGSTQNIDSDCTGCFVDQPNLADLIEASGRTWKTYQEDMPSPCFVGDAEPYVQKHSPFIYFDSIRLNSERCGRSVVPLTQLDKDLASGQLPNFSFIMPNLCNSGHDCSRTIVDPWMKDMIEKLQSSSSLGSSSLIIITYDEAGGKSVESCCGMGEKAGGKIATILISPEAKPNFEDNTAYSHYSLLKTILAAWNLPALGQAGMDATPLIEAPWLKAVGSAVKNTLAPELITEKPVDTTGPTPGSTLPFPIRAAFFYPWFPESWRQNGMETFSQYHPTLGYYNQDDPDVVRKEIAAMQYGRIQAAISSWWGQGHYTDRRFPQLLKAGEETGFYWAVYMEEEGYSNPSQEAIRSDLEYIRSQYSGSRAYLKIDGRMVVFVYADQEDGCSMVDRWIKANSDNTYLILKVFPGYRTCSNQPDAWHQYAPDNAQKQVGKSSFSISPGFWMANAEKPRLIEKLDWPTCF